jgi:hypothetical protein
LNWDGSLAIPFLFKRTDTKESTRLSPKNVRQCICIVNALLVRMSGKRGSKAGTAQFSITLPAEAVVLIERLARTGLYGVTRAEVSKSLILDGLKNLPPLVAAQIIAASTPSSSG